MELIASRIKGLLTQEDKCQKSFSLENLTSIQTPIARNLKDNLEKTEDLFIGVRIDFIWKE